MSQLFSGKDNRKFRYAFTQKKPRNGGFFCGYLFYALEFVTD